VPEASLTFPAELQSVGAARRFLRATLLDWETDDYEYAAALVITELATNATLHARTPYTVLLRLEPTHLVVEVLDSSPQLPQARHYASDAATGRGINLVDAFSDTWGATPTPDGKVVWAHVLPDDPAFFAVTDLAATDDADGTGRTSIPKHQPGEGNDNQPTADETAA
jgi:anti-sigma regulatory factor (Ser/Thr protein kinase)